MELSGYLFILLLFCSTYSNKIIEDEHQGSTLPRFTWLDNYNILVSFPNGVEDTIKLRTADKIGNMIVPCLYEGVLLHDNSSSMAVSGCQHEDLVHIVMYSSNLPNHTMFNIINGTTQEVEKINFDENNTRVGRKGKRRIKKRGAYLDDDDYDEVAFDGSDPPEPPPFLSFEVKLAFEESLLAEKKTEVAAREYIARVFTLGKQHFQHTSLGTKIRLRAQGPIRRIPGKSWNPSTADLKESRQYKDPENIPITFFCYNEDRDNDVGIAYIRRACHEEKGVSIVAARADINKAAQSYSHETGHWLGLPHDIVECEGQGIMSRIDTPGGRPSKWSHCNERKFNRWFYYENKKFSKCLKEDGEVLQKESSCLATSYETVVTSDLKCDSVIVSGADYGNCNGEYLISDERVPWSPSKPVYAHVTLDRYIYFNVRDYGWSIGNTEDLRTGAYFHYSGLDSSEPWEASWRNGTTVQCKAGNLTKEAGEKYIGDIENGVGSKEWEDGSIYMGEWKNGQRDGSGTYLASDRVKSIGAWKEDKQNGQGTKTWPVGDKYVGNFEDDKRNGQGTCTYSSGNKYTGLWKDDYRHGEGNFTWISGSTFTGEWKDGNRHGQGTYIWHSGEEFTGEWRDGSRNGQGTMIYPSGDKYTGEWRDSNRNGKGTLIWVNGDIYIGDWVDDDRHGKGTLIWNDLGRYDGDWENSKQNGKGRKMYANGDIYGGDWKNDKRHGKGLYLWSDGVKYDGQFKDGKKDGQGTNTWTDGTEYTGEWKADQQSGQGTKTWPTGDKYVGQWKNDKQYGNGTLIWSDGRKYDGEWREGKQNGQGTMTWPDGKIWTGMWVDDKEQKMAL